MASPIDNEQERLDALCALNILDTPPEERFDRITRLAASFFEVPIALVSLIDENRQWFKSRFGLDAPETPRSIAFCSYAIQSPDPLIIENALNDARFAQNPAVLGEPFVRFYAGQPIFSESGYALGTLCVVDTKPRSMNATQLSALQDFAKLVEHEIARVDANKNVVQGQKALQASEARFQATFEQASVGIAHVGLNGAWLRVNQKLCEIIGYEKREIEKLTFQDITHPDDLAPDLALVSDLLGGKINSYELEKRYFRKAGEIVWINLTVSLVKKDDNSPDYFIAVIEDIQAKKEAQYALQELNEELEQRIKNRTKELQAKNNALAAEIQIRASIENTLRASQERIRTFIDASHDAFIEIDAHGVITSWNKSAENVFGWKGNEALGKELSSTIIPLKYQDAHQKGLNRFIQTGNGLFINRRIELPARTKSGKEIPVELTITPYQVNGDYFFAAFLNNISERKEAADKLEQKQQLLDAILETVDVGVVACSSEGHLTLFNQAARDMHGLGLPYVPIGANDWANHYDLYCADGKTPLSMREVPLYKALQGEIVDDAEMMIVPKNKEAKFVLASGRALQTSNGINLGAVIAMKDVTELKRSEKLLESNEQRLRAITENLPTLIGQVDRNERFLFLNGRSAKFFGKGIDVLMKGSVRDAYGDEEYRRIKPHVDMALSGHKAVFEGFTVFNGKKHYYHAIFIPDQDAYGNVSGFFAMAFDITQRRISELKQAESEDRLRTITDNLPVLISYIDKDMKYHFANGKYHDWFGVAPEAMIGKSMVEVFGTDFFENRKKYALRCLSGEVVRFEIEKEVKGSLRTIESIYLPHIKDNEAQGFYVLSTDITITKDQEKQLQLLARSDPLTGLPNRRSYEEKLNGAVQRVKRTSRPIALMFLDVDHFKQINDTYGHAGGDEVLKEFARRLQLSVRVTDTVSRLAGDEFTIILEQINNCHDAIIVGQKILDLMKEPFLLQGQLINISTSIGITCQLSDSADVESLSKEADEALYKAKTEGRNRFHLMNASNVS